MFQKMMSTYSLRNGNFCRISNLQFPVTRPSHDTSVFCSAPWRVCQKKKQQSPGNIVILFPLPILVNSVFRASRSNTHNFWYLFLFWHEKLEINPRRFQDVRAKFSRRRTSAWQNARLTNPVELLLLLWGALLLCKESRVKHIQCHTILESFKLSQQINAWATLLTKFQLFLPYWFGIQASFEGASQGQAEEQISCFCEDPIVSHFHTTGTPGIRNTTARHG